jgi:hypothetical protein
MLEGQLLESVYDEGPFIDGFGRRLEGYIVPVNCENSGTRCVPATFEERGAISKLAEGGYIHFNNTEGIPMKAGDLPVEYLLSNFGVKMIDSSLRVSTVVAKPVDACSPLTNVAEVRDKAVLVRRGGCPFVKKAEEIQAAGGRMLIGNQHPYLVRMGVEPRWKGLNIAIPVVMVSKRAYSILVGESYAVGGTISFQENGEVSSGVWVPLEKLSNGEGWPRSDAYVGKRHLELREEHAGWPDRLAR